MDPYAEHTVSFDGGATINYIVAGPEDGPLIIFMHGWPGIAKTWQPQLQTFASLGFRVVAPDMPGYGRSTARNVHSDYAQERIVRGMLAVLADTGRDMAVWVGHDWGCGTLWTLANTHPEVCRAVAGLCVPYAGLELGLDEVLKTVDRTLYPEDEFPYGQWSYQVFYEQSFDKATAVFDKDIPNVLRRFNRPGDPAAVTKPASTANVVKDGGWFGGAEAPPVLPNANDDSSVHGSDVFQELVAAMQKTGFGPGDSWYLNHKANRKYNLQHTKNNGRLDMPVHFIHASYDTVCLTVTGHMADRMRETCSHLSESVIDAGHWVAAEKSQETNAALTKWLVEEVKDWWPGPGQSQRL